MSSSRLATASSLYSIYDVMIPPCFIRLPGLLARRHRMDATARARTRVSPLTRQFIVSKIKTCQYTWVKGITATCIHFSVHVYVMVFISL